MNMGHKVWLIVALLLIAGCATVNEPCYQLISMRQDGSVLMFDACNGNMVTLTPRVPVTTTTLPVY
jgi:uncharacterized lipoprotein YajG